MLPGAAASARQLPGKGGSSAVSWLAVQTRSGRESYARSNAERDGHETYLPLCRDPESRRIEPLFPRYFFVRRCERWWSLRSTVGVQGVVRRGAEPDEMRDQIVDELRSREDELGLVRLDAEEFLVGCRVRAVGGAMIGKIGTYCGAPRHRRCDVMFELLGASRLVSVPREYLRAA